MSQVGKLYKYYLKKIFRRNWLRIIIFTLLIGVVWWFVIPWGCSKFISGQFNKNIERSNLPEEERTRRSQRVEENWSFANACRNLFGVKGEGKEFWDTNRFFLEENVKSFKELKASGTDEKTLRELKGWILVNEMIDSGSFGIPFPFNANNTFFFNQTENYAKGKPFWKLLNDISWWNLTGVVVLFWFIFAVLDNLFFTSQQNGEEAVVLTFTPGAKRSDLLWGKVFAFLTFYFIVNILLFLIPFGIYYWWLGTSTSIGWFALLGLWTTIIGPILHFGLILVPYLFFGSLMSWGKWIISALVSFGSYLWFVLKNFTLFTWPYTVEQKFFDPVWFTVISLAAGIIFLALYYWRYQNQDLDK